MGNKKLEPYPKALRFLSVLSIIFLITLVYLIHFYPDTGLNLLWNFVIIVSPLIFLLAPNAWINLCPLAIVQSLPRRFRWSKE
ncbi:MAG: hypothetical protein M9962_11010 [Oligoflexia bacterium]|nr:hypothetical protein [Oligoflexia bacterium]